MVELGNARLFFDRLAERGLIDRWAFLLFATGGAASIWLLKAVELSSILIAAGAAALMLGYAALVGVGVSKLRADQAGDNCYYLGLIYTLASLSYAIFTFDPANTATTIVQGFGIALATTIMGLVLRVFFTQSRVDVADAEETTRIALFEAASQVRGQLDSVVQSFSLFALQTQQHLQELRDQVRADVKEISETASSAISLASDEAMTAVSAQASESTAAMRRIGAGAGKLVTALEAYAATVDQLQTKTGNNAAQLEALEKTSNGLKAAMAQVIETAGHLQREQSALISGGDRFASSAAAIAEGVNSIESASRGFDDLVARRLAEANNLPIEVGHTAQRKIDDAVDGLANALQEWAARQQTALAGIEAASVSQVASLGRHNTELEAELAKSRGNVTKVHSALVELTESLANRVENGSTR